MYGEQNFSLNEVVEVVGILSVDPALAPTPGHSEEELRGMEVEEEAAHSPPPSLVPRSVKLVAVFRRSHELRGVNFWEIGVYKFSKLLI